MLTTYTEGGCTARTEAVAGFVERDGWEFLRALEFFRDPPPLRLLRRLRALARRRHLPGAMVHLADAAPWKRAAGQRMPGLGRASAPLSVGAGVPGRNNYGGLR